MRLKQEKLAKKTSLLIVASGLVSKILAATYRIPYQNLVGDRGFYAYQQLYPLLAIISTLSLTALPNLVATLYHSRKKDLRALFQLELAVSSVLAVLFLLFGQVLAEVMGAAALGFALRLVGLNWFCLPFISFYRGLAQAELKMMSTAVTQVLEQGIRVGVIIFAAVSYLTFGWDIYQTATLASLGNLVASVILLAYLVKNSEHSLKNYLHVTDFDWTFLKTLGFQSLGFVFFALYLLLFQLVDAFTVKSALVASGHKSLLCFQQLG